MWKRILAFQLCITLLLAFPVYAGVDTKQEDETKTFYGIHTTYGPSVWGVRFQIGLTYDNSNSSAYNASRLSTIASMYPKHTFGSGDVIIAGIVEQADYGTTVNRSIRPTTSSFWSGQALIVPTGTVVYYSCVGNLNKDFRYLFEERGEFTFAVPDTYIPSPNYTLTLSVQGPK